MSSPTGPHYVSVNKRVYKLTRTDSSDEQLSFASDPCIVFCVSVSGRSRLHLLDLGSCETDVSRTREGGGGQCLSLSALGNVILALANGAKHVPYRSELTLIAS